MLLDYCGYKFIKTKRGADQDETSLKRKRKRILM